MALIIYVNQGDPTAANFAARALEEGQWYNDIGKGYRARADKAFQGGQPHVHVYFKGNQICVVNQDGTPSHNSDLGRMPSRVRDYLKTRQLIESMLTEDVRDEGFLVPPDVIAQAVAACDHERIITLSQNLLKR